MHTRRLLLITALTLLALLSQFVPFQDSAAVSRCNWAYFVSDVSVPDGTVFSPGAAFLKTWRLKNIGTCTWTSKYALAYVSGDPLGATSSVTFPTTAPGQVADLTLDMNAPTTPGHYRGYWMLSDASNVKFGLGEKADKSFWVDINVSSPPSPTPTLPPGATGILLKGTVRRNGAGVAGVHIYFGNYYPGPGGDQPGTTQIVATTGADGKYSTFVPISGDYERMVIFAELAGYSFEPAVTGWYHKAGLETRTVDFVAAPGTPAPFPGPGSAYEFGYRAQEAAWYSGAGLLTYPGTEGDSRGFVRQSNVTTYEDGTIDSIGPNLVVAPQNVNNGYIQGIFPAINVYKGYRFRTSVGCAYGWDCYVTFRLDYRIGAGAINTFWSWTEKNDNQVYFLDRDLSVFAGQKVSFYLTVLANGSPAGDRAIWGRPRIVQTDPNASNPTPVTPSPTTVTPVVTVPLPPPGALLDFATAECAASWKSGAGALPCPATDGDARGFALLVNNPKLENGALDSAPGLILSPQNKYDGYIQGTYPAVTIQAGDRFQGIVGCAYGFSCYVTFRLDYVLENGTQVKFWTWAEKNEGKTYRVDKDLSALAGKKVKFVLMLLATGPATNDQAIWGQPRIVRAGYTAPTSTPTPEAPKVTAATVSIVPLNSIGVCGGPNPVDVSGAITVSAPTTVVFHWAMGGDKTDTTADETLTFTTAGVQTIREGAYTVDCGNYTAQLVVTSPNAFASNVFHYSISPATPTPTPPETPTPSATPTPLPGAVTAVKATVNIPPYLSCTSSLNVDLLGEITTSGPASVTYYWEVGKDGTVTSTSPANTLDFASAATQTVNFTAGVGCGNYFVRLVVTSPTAMSSQADFILTKPTVLPIYDFNTFKAIGTLACTEVVNYAWTTEPCNGESGGCWISTTPLFGYNRAGFFRHEGNTICNLSIP